MTPSKSSDVVWWYKPTLEEMKKVAIKPWLFKLSWDGVFHTIQGEGDWIWKPTTFIRLQLCNLKCERCDAWYTWRTDTKEFYSEPVDLSVDELHDAIIKAQDKYWTRCRNLTFTGWEPMMQQRTIKEFIAKYPDYIIQVETNGTLPLLPEILAKCKFNCSPKLAMSWNDLKRRLSENVLKQLDTKDNTCYKFVFKTIEDIDEVLELYSFLDRSKIWFMPEWVTKEENAEVFESTIDHIISTGCNVTVRAQNIMRDGAKRWV